MKRICNPFVDKLIVLIFINSYQQQEIFLHDRVLTTTYIVMSVSDYILKPHKKSVTCCKMDEAILYPIQTSLCMQYRRKSTLKILENIPWVLAVVHHKNITAWSLSEGYKWYFITPWKQLQITNSIQSY